MLTDSPAPTDPSIQQGRKYEGKVVTMVSVDEEQWQQNLLPLLLEMNDDDDE